MSTRFTYVHICKATGKASGVLTGGGYVKFRTEKAALREVKHWEKMEREMGMERDFFRKVLPVLSHEAFTYREYNAANGL